MDRPSTRSWILPFALAACRSESDSAALVVQSISVPDFGLWECNRPIEFAFEQRIDFASVSIRSIHIRTSAGVPAAGTFAAKAIDANGDGAADGTDERVVVFFPSCPQADDLSDAGLTPGARYLVTLAGTDSGADPAAVLRSLSGNALAQTVVLAFETIADLARTLHDEKPGAPAPLLRAAGASAGLACYLELGEDPANRVFFEAGPVFGRTPSAFRAPLNLLGDPATHVAFVVVFDQVIDSAPANLAHLWLEYNATLVPSGWRAFETRAELLSNCRPGDPVVRLVPFGSFPPGGFVRVQIEAGFQDLVGEATPFDSFVITEVTTVAFTSLDPAGAVADELHEEFDFGAGSPLSLMDPVAALGTESALWGQGELRSSPGIVALPPELREFDWVVRSREVFTFDTTSTLIAGGPNGVRTMVQETSGGFVALRNLLVEANGEVRVVGPNPMVIHASGTVTIRGLINANGFDAPDLPASGTNPAEGGLGAGGGGAGGSGNPGVDARGNTGSGAFGAEAGGGGGESGFAPETLGALARRGGGGGGGRFANDRDPLSAERGGDGADEGTGVESGLSPARGGATGPEVFLDGDPSNDFYGVQPIVDASGTVVGRRRGELERIHAGSGGGNGGDSIAADGLPLPPVPTRVVEGGGGGGGGGALVIRARGPIVFGPRGQIRANGGSGACRGAPFQTSEGTCGGSGSGGQVILESAEAIDFTGGGPLIVARSWIQAIGGPRALQPPSSRGSGGVGGPGVVQFHVTNPERAIGDPASNVILPLDALTEPDPLFKVCQPRPHILFLAGARSSARSRWVPLAAAGEGGASGPESTLAFLFDGLETAPGEDQGRVRTSGGRVVEPTPILGPENLAEPGVEFLPDGSSLRLSGPVLAPLRASAQPISPDVYLRTPALLEGQTLRFANAADPERRTDFTIASARYDDGSSALVLAVGNLLAPLGELAAQLGGAGQVEFALVPRFFRVRQGPLGVDLLPDSHYVRILFQGAADDGSGHADDVDPLVDWTGDVAEFDALAPGALAFVRFQVEFELDADGDGFDPDAEPLALEFLRLPFRY